MGNNDICPCFSKQWSNPSRFHKESLMCLTPGRMICSLKRTHRDCQWGFIIRDIDFQYLRYRWGGSGRNSEVHLILLTAPPSHNGYYLDHCSQQNVWTSDEMEWVERAADGQTGKGRERNETLLIHSVANCPYRQVFPDCFKIWVKINELIVNQ